MLTGIALSTGIALTSIAYSNNQDVELSPDPQAQSMEFVCGPSATFAGTTDCLVKGSLTGLVAAVVNIQTCDFMALKYKLSLRTHAHVSLFDLIVSLRDLDISQGTTCE